MYIKVGPAFVTGDHPYVRVYCQGGTEIFELLTSSQGQVYLIDHAKLPLGESISNYIYEDWTYVFDFLKRTPMLIHKINASDDECNAWIELMNLALPLFRANPLFLPITQAIYAMRAEYMPGTVLEEGRLLALLPSYEGLFERLAHIIRSCFSDGAEAAPEDEYFRLGLPPLTFGRVSAELVQTDVYLVEPSDGPLKSRLLTSDDLLERGLPHALCGVLYPDSVADIVSYLLCHILESKMRFRPCKLCGRYFAAKGKSKLEYCTRLIDDSDKTCRQMGASRIYTRNSLEDPAVRLFRRSYQTHYSRLRSGLISQTEFDAWSKAAQEKRDQCVAGKLTVTQLQEWLERDRIR